MQKLLTLQTAFSNWDIYQRTQGLNWTSTATMCTGWQGVQCNTAGNVIGLNFSAPDIEPPQRLRALEGVTNMTVHSSQPIALQGADLACLTHMSASPYLLVMMSEAVASRRKAMFLVKSHSSGSILSGESDSVHLVTVLRRTSPSCSCA